MVSTASPLYLGTEPPDDLATRPQLQQMAQAWREAEETRQPIDCECNASNDRECEHCAQRRAWRPK